MTRRKTLAVGVAGAALATAVGLLATPGAQAAPPYVYDVSWPQCPGPGNQPMPAPAATSFVIIGLTNGRAFSDNPCIATQRKWAVDNEIGAHAYTMASYPTAAQLKDFGAAGPWRGSTDASRLRNVGYAEGVHAAATLSKVGWKPSTVWIDVEPSGRQPWPATTDRAKMLRNRFVVEGVMRGLQAKGFAIGIYSSPGAWSKVVGPWWLPGVPAWTAVGKKDETAARAACTAATFSGGRAFLAQWTDGRYDFNVTCSGWSTTPAKAPAPSAGNDVNGDWKDDLLARQASTSTLWLYKGNGAATGGVFQPRASTGTLASATYDLVETAGDLTGDGRADLLTRRTDGTLLLQPGTAGASWGTARSLGTGWNAYRAVTGIGDFTGDGRPDLVALRSSDGLLLLFPGDGKGGLGAPTALKSGLSGMDRVVGVGDLTLNGIPDLVMREKATGTLWFYPGYANGALGTRISLGTGWASTALFAGPGDFTADGVPDLVTRATNGTLWLHPGRTDGRLGARRSIGTAWTGMNAIA